MEYITEIIDKGILNREEIPGLFTKFLQRKNKKKDDKA